MKQLNKYSELYVDCSMHHGLDDDCVSCGIITSAKAIDDCTPCTYGSTFGTSATNQKTTEEYMAGRFAVFSHAIMWNRIHHPGTPVLPFGATGESFFRDCENKRECNQTENPTLCNTSTLCDGHLVLPQTE
ncbi:MAG: hypothetical protein ABJB05_10975 [Parafilimonas sp.]